MNKYSKTNTICALSTPQGSGAIAVIRVSGEGSITALEALFRPHGALSLRDTGSQVIRFGTIENSKGKVIDEVLVSIFRAPHSYTGEDSVEISCHGSDFIVQEVLKLLLANGCRLAEPGEFTRRAFLNGKMDLAQAEGVADLIASETAAAHEVAMKQMKGGFSAELLEMRRELLEIVSLMELELDFSEEDVEFADRKKLKHLVEKISLHIEKLIESFALGNVIKNGVPVAIIGATNVGKSTLLNLLLGEERAIVSDIHGTTRDSIEDTVKIGETVFRFIDTAGLRKTEEKIELMGIERTLAKMQKASIIIGVFDAERTETFDYTLETIKGIETSEKEAPKYILLLNKADRLTEDKVSARNPYLSTVLTSISEKAEKKGLSPIAVLPICAKTGEGYEELKEVIAGAHKALKVSKNATLVTNLRHYEALCEALESLKRVSSSMTEELPTDLVAQDIRETLYHIGTITGEISSDEILGNIFKNFCIGK